MFLIAHGNFNAFSTLARIPFLQNHFEVLFFALSFLYWLYPHSITLLLLQNFFAVGTGVVVWLWTGRLLRDMNISRLQQQVLTGLVILVLVLDPWEYWGVAFDFHLEAAAAFFLTLAGYEFYCQRFKWGILWSVLTLATGDVAGTYIVGLGLSLLLSSRNHRLYGVGLMLLGVVWVVMLQSLHLGKGSGLLSIYGYLAVGSGPGLVGILRGVLTHPDRVISMLSSRWADLYANVAPLGIVGIVSPLGVGVSVITLLEAELASNLNIASPGFQTLPLIPYASVGLAFYAAIAFRKLPHKVALSLCGALALNSILWAAAWLPHVPTHWIRVSEPAATALATARSYIPPSDEVVASSGVVGRFAKRRYVYQFSEFPQNAYHKFSIPLHSPIDYFVVSPFNGVEISPPDSQLYRVVQLLRQPGARLMSKKGDIWVIAVPRTASSSLVLAESPSVLPSWVLRSTAGHPQMTGKEPTWSMVSSSNAGYVIYGDYWPELPGRLRATIALTAHQHVNFELWNDSTGQLLAKSVIHPKTGEQVIHLTANLPRLGPVGVYRGQGPFIIKPAEPRRANILELRLWKASGSKRVLVNWVSLTRAGSSS